MTPEAVDTALDEVRPYLIADGGNVEVAGVEDGTVYLRLQVRVTHNRDTELRGPAVVTCVDPACFRAGKEELRVKGIRRYLGRYCCGLTRVEGALSGASTKRSDIAASSRTGLESSLKL